MNNYKQSYSTRGKKCYIEYNEKHKINEFYAMDSLQ